MTRLQNLFYLSKQGSDKFTETQEKFKEMRFYAEAHEILAPVPYVFRKRSIYKAAYGFSILYHPISFTLSLATAILMAVIFAGFEWKEMLNQPFQLSSLLIVLMLLVSLLLFVLLFAGIELAKNHYATEVFRHQQNYNRQAKTYNMAYLLALVVLSTLISGVGGACISYISSDKSEVYQTKFKVQKDSLQRLYEPKIKRLENQIATLNQLQGNTQLRRWGLTEKEHQQLIALQEDKKILSKDYKELLQNTKNEHQQAIMGNIDTTSLYIWLTVLIVLVTELLNIRAYQVRYAYLQKVRLEGISLGYIEPALTLNFQAATAPAARELKKIKVLAKTKKFGATATFENEAKINKDNRKFFVIQANKEENSSLTSKEVRQEPFQNEDKIEILSHELEEIKEQLSDSSLHARKLNELRHKNAYKLSEEEIQKAHKMLSTNISVSKVAEILGVSKYQIEKLKKMEA